MAATETELLPTPTYDIDKIQLPPSPLKNRTPGKSESNDNQTLLQLLNQLEEHLTAPHTFCAITPSQTLTPLLEDLNVLEDSASKDSQDRIAKIKEWCKDVEGDAVKAAASRDSVSTLLSEIVRWPEWNWETIQENELSNRKSQIDEIKQTLLDLPIEHLKSRVSELRKAKNAELTPPAYLTIHITFSLLPPLNKLHSLLLLYSTRFAVYDLLLEFRSRILWLDTFLSQHRPGQVLQAQKAVEYCVDTARILDNMIDTAGEPLPESWIDGFEELEAKIYAAAEEDILSSGDERLTKSKTRRTLVEVKDGVSEVEEARQWTPTSTPGLCDDEEGEEVVVIESPLERDIFQMTDDFDSEFYMNNQSQDDSSGVDFQQYLQPIRRNLSYELRLQFPTDLEERKHTLTQDITVTTSTSTTTLASLLTEDEDMRNADAESSFSSMGSSLSKDESMRRASKLKPSQLRGNQEVKDNDFEKLARQDQVINERGLNLMVPSRRSPKAASTQKRQLLDTPGYHDIHPSSSPWTESSPTPIYSNLTDSRAPSLRTWDNADEDTEEGLDPSPFIARGVLEIENLDDVHDMLAAQDLVPTQEHIESDILEESSKEIRSSNSWTLGSPSSKSLDIQVEPQLKLQTPMDPSFEKGNDDINDAENDFQAREMLPHMNSPESEKSPNRIDEASNVPFSPMKEGTWNSDNFSTPASNISMGLPLTSSPPSAMSVEESSAIVKPAYLVHRNYGLLASPTLGQQMVSRVKEIDAISFERKKLMGVNVDLSRQRENHQRNGSLGTMSRERVQMDLVADSQREKGKKLAEENGVRRIWAVPVVEMAGSDDDDEDPGPQMRDLQTTKEPEQLINSELHSKVKEILTSMPDSIELLPQTDSFQKQKLSSEEKYSSTKRRSIAKPAEYGVYTLRRVLSPLQRGSNVDGSSPSAMNSGKKQSFGGINLYCRILSDRVMVRVGGGWVDLELYLVDYLSRREKIDGSHRRKSAATDLKDMEEVEQVYEIVNLDHRNANGYDRPLSQQSGKGYGNLSPGNGGRRSVSGYASLSHLERERSSTPSPHYASSSRVFSPLGHYSLRRTASGGSSGRESIIGEIRHRSESPISPGVEEDEFRLGGMGMRPTSSLDGTMPRRMFIRKKDTRGILR